MFLCVLAVAAGSSLLGQNTFPSSGSVGIGTTSPVSPLQVVGSGGMTNATFGASSGTGVFDILGLYGGDNLFADLSSNLFYSGSWNLRNTSYDGWMLAMNVTDDAAGQWGVYHAAPGANPATLTPFLTIDSEGQVGIGTISPADLLHVAGTIGAEEVIVSSTGADYVFDKDYRLAPLSEVAAYVKEKHHLPDIPTADEEKEKGVGLGDMQTKLLAKVEELTLHMIEAEEHSKRLEQENLELKQETQKLRE